MKLGKLKNAQLSKQSHEIGFVQRVQFAIIARPFGEKLKVTSFCIGFSDETATATCQ
jgi:hypothetical protein